jgi:hypothetical protein
MECHPSRTLKIVSFSREVHNTITLSNNNISKTLKATENKFWTGKHSVTVELWFQNN